MEGNTIMANRCHYLRSLMSTNLPRLQGPGGFLQARREGASFMVENRPYVPSLMVDLNDPSTVVNAVKVILSCVGKTKTDNIETAAKVSIMNGGLTNALFRVDIDNEQKSPPTTSVLVRIFGAEGMIDRDKETANFARLCNAKGSVVHSQLDYLGRFGNGRVETLIPNVRAATISDLGEKEDLVLEVTRQMARLHYGFDIPEYLLEKDSIVSSCGGDYGQPKPVLLDIIASWNDELITKISQACSRDPQLVDIFSSALFGDTLQIEHIATDGEDGNKSTLTEIISHIAQKLTLETRWIQDYVNEHHPDAPIAFCHNDINTGNILLSDGSESGDSNGYDRDSVAMIDYEYAGFNYTMFDVANFICEHCGGNDNGIPDYKLIPSLEMQRKLLRQYVQERDKVAGNGATKQNENDEVSELLSQVQTFQMLSNLYWGTWGILQGVAELLEGGYEIESVKLRLCGEIDIDEWDNLRYGKNRLNRYRELKQSMLETTSNK